MIKNLKTSVEKQEKRRETMWGKIIDALKELESAEKVR
jgi:hypothetical protein